MRGRSIGVLLVWTLAAVAGQPAAWGFGGGGTRGAGPARPVKAAIGFELYRDYLIVVQGAAGPMKGLTFLLDTGATPSVLDPRVAAKLHLDVTGEDIAVLGGSVRGGRAMVPELEVGPIRKENLPVLVQDLSYLQGALPFRVDGIVGLDLLGQSAFVIDYTTREIRFGAAPMRDSIPLQMKQGLALVDATVNHASVHLLLDTGAPSLILFEQAAVPVAGSKISGPQPSPKKIGEGDRKPVRVSSFSLGGTDFGGKPAFVVTSPRDEGHDFDGLMSPVALGIARVEVDVERGTLAFARE